MPNFSNPFYGNVPRKMDTRELMRAIRLNIAAEEEATALYEAHADATDNPLAKKVFQDVANEERVHVGEFIKLLDIICNDEIAWIDNGYEEVEEMAEEVAAGNFRVKTPAEKAAEEHGAEDSSSSSTTLGSMK